MLHSHFSIAKKPFPRTKSQRQLGFEPLEGRRMLSLTHWYTFNDGTTADLVGGADAVLHNGAQVLQGQLALRNVDVSSGNAANVQYASLPTNLLQSADSTIAVWYTALDSADWSRVFDIGNQTGNAADTSLFYTAHNGSAQSSASLKPSGANGPTTLSAASDSGTQHMAAVVIDTSAGLLRMYLDGVQQSSAALNGLSANSINDAVAYLGRSLYNSDQGYTGLIDEVRVFDTALSSVQLADQANQGTFTSTLAGDFNNDQTVDARDYAYWRESGAMPGGLEVWKANYAATENGPPPQTLSLVDQSLSLATLTGTQVTLAGQSELHLSGTGNPLSGSVVQLDSPDAWLFLHNIKPSQVNATHLSHIRIGDAMAMEGANVRVVQHALGTVILPHTPDFAPLEVFSGPQFTGTSVELDQYVYYNSAGLGAMTSDISSLKLKRGYMAVVATNSDGTGASRTYVAQDYDLHLSLLDAEFDNSIKFVHVLPWRWVSKKGASDASPDFLDAAWFYNWNNNAASTLDYEYVPIKQQPFWPADPYNQTDVSHWLGFNEPDNPVEDAYENLGNGSVDAAIAWWPNMLKTGVRVGSPAVTDGGKAWLYEFMDKAIAQNLRVDYIAIHNYQANHSASSLQNWLQDVYDRYGLPIWITEFNNGANWTGSTPSSNSANAAVIDSFIQMFDETPWIERYSIYGAVEEVRDIHNYTNGALSPTGSVYYNNESPIGYQQQAFASGSSEQVSSARLTLDGDTLDHSGYGVNGHATGLPSYVTGQAGQAIDLDGTDDFIRLTSDAANGSEFTFAAWVNWDGGAQWQRIFDFGNDTSQNLFLTPRSGSNTLRFAIKNGGGEQIVETAQLSANQWKHVAVTVGGGSAKLYVDGNLMATNNSVTIAPSDFNPVNNYLGKSQYPDPLFDGSLDEVILTDTVLSATQIAGLMNNAAPVFANPVLTLPTQNGAAAFSYSIAGTATDPDSVSGVTYAKANGPAWLNVSPAGVLSGITPAGTITQEFVIVATDQYGASTPLVVNIPITGGGGGGFAPLASFASSHSSDPNAFEIAVQQMFAEDASEQWLLAQSLANTPGSDAEPESWQAIAELENQTPESTTSPFDSAFAAL